MFRTYQHQSVVDADLTLNTVLDLIIEGTWDWNQKTGHVDRSPGWYRMLGYEVGIFRQDVFSWENLIHPDDYDLAMTAFEGYISGQNPRYEVEYRIKKNDGSYLWIVDRGVAVVRNNQGQVVRMIGAHHNIDRQKKLALELAEKERDLQMQGMEPGGFSRTRITRLEQENTKLERKLEELAHRSSTDPLTGIANRRHFEQVLFREVARSKRYGHPLCLAIFDIDFFKQVNDRYGHHLGDQVLQIISRCVADNIRTIDMLARWGGEEFVIIYPDSDIHACRQAVENIRALLASQKMPEGLCITCSFGLAAYRTTDTVGSLFHRADQLLYRAKQEGRNQVVSERDGVE